MQKQTDYIHFNVQGFFFLINFWVPLKMKAN